MNKSLYTLLKIGRRVSIKFRGSPSLIYQDVKITDQDANNLIRKRIQENKPAMICRFGSTELNCITAYSNMKRFPLDYKKYLTGEIDYLVWEKSIYHPLEYISGFFPMNIPMLEKFCELMIEEMKHVDILGSWCEQEKFFKDELVNATKVRLQALEPYYHQDPWSEALKNKKVLVIHPNEESVRSQYQKRALLFKNKKVLPEFELKTIKAIQSMAYSKRKFETWFDALDYMKKQIDNTDFDVAIIGCGAYGFPLAGHVKRIGKKAVHLGGASQILFGIKGKRWEAIPEISSLMNEHWARPLASEVPKGSERVEGGAYW